MESVQEYLDYFHRERVALQITQDLDRPYTIHMLFTPKKLVLVENENQDIMELLRDAKAQYEEFIQSIFQTSTLI